MTACRVLQVTPSLYKARNDDLGTNMAREWNEAEERQKRALNVRIKGVPEEEGEDVKVVVERLFLKLGLQRISPKVKDSCKRIGRENANRARDIILTSTTAKFKETLLGLQEGAASLGFGIYNDLTRIQMDELNKTRDREVQSLWERSLILLAPRLEHQSLEQDEEELFDHVAAVIYSGLGFLPEELDVNSAIVRVTRLRSSSGSFGRCKPVKIEFVDKKTRDEVFRWREELRGTYYRLEEPRKPRQQSDKKYFS